jgi:hypothetical protein
MWCSRVLEITVSNTISQLGNIQTKTCRLAAGLETFKGSSDNVYCTQTRTDPLIRILRVIENPQKHSSLPARLRAVSTLPHAVELQVLGLWEKSG